MFIDFLKLIEGRIIMESIILTDVKEFLSFFDTIWVA